jgi:CheY-like chemotaxis protein
MIIAHTLAVSKPELDLSGKNILIVDDYSEMRTVLRGILYNCNADPGKIQMADNGNQAIVLLKEARFDIVLCDFIQNPERTANKC